MNRTDIHSRLDVVWQSFVSGEYDEIADLLQNLRLDLTSDADAAGVFGNEHWSVDADDLLYGYTTIGTLARKAGMFEIPLEVHRLVLGITEKWFNSNRHALWYFVNSTSQIAAIFGCQYLSINERECLLALQSKMSEVTHLDGDLSVQMLQKLKGFIISRILAVEAAAQIDPELMLADARIARRQIFESDDPDAAYISPLLSAWPGPDLDYSAAPGTFEEGETFLANELRQSEMHLRESEEKLRNGDSKGALDTCNSALTIAEAVSANFRGSYGARLNLARAIQERARVLEQLGLVAESLRERSLSEGVLQDAIVAFPIVPELLFNLSWIQSQLGAAMVRLNQSRSEGVAYYLAAIATLKRVRDEKIYQPEVIKLLALFECFVMSALGRKNPRDVYAHANEVFELLKEIRANDPEDRFPFEMIDRIAFLNSGIRGKLLKKSWYSAMK
ncbi:MAG: hypothetical protein WA359_10705 [Acidimicrobiales bacterium]